MRGGPELITLEVPEAAFTAMAAAAKARGDKPQRYAQKIFDSTLKGLLGRKRGMPATDAELDEQVRLVLACAGQGSAAAIAQATGLPVERVERFLEGLRTVGSNPALLPSAGETLVPSMPLESAGGVALQEPAAAAADAGRSRRTWAPDMVERVRVLWASGSTEGEIAAAIGATKGAVHQFVLRNREVCPHRCPAEGLRS